MGWWVRTAGVVLAALLVGGSSPALAHTPVFVDSPSLEAAFPVADVTYQTGLYGTLAYPGAVQYYEVTLAEPRTVSLFLVVPNSPNCRAFRPQLAVIGPGVSEVVAYPGLTVPEGMSVVAVASPFWGRYTDPDTRLLYFAGPRFYPELAAGTQYLAVFDETGGTGNFMLLVGDLDAPSDDFSWVETAKAHHACGG
jgi:hypothetical protein